MAGFEVVVRPAIFPQIRPAPAQPVPPSDDPDKGFATIHGNGAKTVSSSYSYSSSISSSQRSEIQRREDEARVYQKDDNGKINKKNFVDIRAPNKIVMKGPPSPKTQNQPSFDFSKGPMGGAMTGDDLTNLYQQREIYFYKRMKEEDNIEIRRKDITTKKG